MSIKVMSWVWDHSRARGSQHHVLLAIADCAAGDGANAYPSMSELTRKTRLCERTVQQAIKGLVQLGELFVSVNDGPHGHNGYRVIMSTPPQVLPPAESAPPQNLHPRRFDAPLKSVKPVQALTNTPAESAPPQNLPPAESAPRTVRRVPPLRGEPSEKNSLSKIGSEVASRPDVEALCEYLADRIEMNGYTRPTITKQWRLDCRMMIDKESRPVANLRRAIEWATADEFWRAVILSMAKLRKHFDTMRDRATQEQRQAKRPELRESSVDGWGMYRAE